jgi:hypothetical protein
VVSRSSAEAEYRGVANAAAECCWLRNLLGELHVVVNKASIIFCDNVSAVYLSDNPVHHKRTKHVELDIHFVRERTALGLVRFYRIQSGRNNRYSKKFVIETRIHSELRFNLLIMIGRTRDRRAGLIPPLD